QRCADLRGAALEALLIAELLAFLDEGLRLPLDDHALTEKLDRLHEHLLLGLVDASIGARSEITRLDSRFEHLALAGNLELLADFVGVLLEREFLAHAPEHRPLRGAPIGPLPRSSAGIERDERPQ